eukprot:gene20-12833_t
MPGSPLVEVQYCQAESCSARPKAAMYCMRLCEVEMTAAMYCMRLCEVEMTVSSSWGSELLGKADGLGALLVDVCTGKAGELLRLPQGSHVLHEVVPGGDDGVLLDIVPTGVTAVQTALVSEVGRDPADLEAMSSEEAGPSLKVEHVMVHYFASRALRRMILASAEGEGRSHDSSCAFVEAVWDGALKGNCKQNGPKGAVPSTTAKEEEAKDTCTQTPGCTKHTARKTPAAKTPAAKTPAAKTPAVQNPAGR